MEDNQIQALLEKGRECQLAGLAGDAQRCYDAILQRDPRHKEAMRLYALLMQDAGHLPGAESLLRTALTVDGEFVDAWINLGQLYLKASQPKEAIACFERAWQLNPESAPVCQLLAEQYFYAGELEKSASQYELAMRLAPENPDLLNNRGILYQLSGYPVEAERCYRESLRLQPRPRTLANLGDILCKLKRHAEAEQVTREALRLEPGNPNTLNTLAVILAAGNRTEEALQLLEEALRIDPRHVNALVNKGGILFHNLRFEEAVQCFRLAEQINPQGHMVRYNLGTAALYAGDYEAGWPYYEGRLENNLVARLRNQSARRLKPGHSVEGKRVLMYAEQGLGDSIQFLRYAKALAARGAVVLAEVQAPLLPLMPSVEGVSAHLAQGDALPEHDYDCPMLSIPYCLGGGASSVLPPSRPWSAPQAQREAWAPLLKRIPGPRIGLVWAGNPEHPNDRRRSIPLALFSRLFKARSELGFVILQKEKRPGDDELLASYPNIHDISSGLASFSDTAAVLEQLDLVISVDTSVAHLAGTMGRPVWMLLARIPDWRWKHDGDGTPWYPGMRLWRQRRKDDWTEVLERVAEALVSL